MHFHQPSTYQLKNKNYNVSFVCLNYKTIKCPARLNVFLDKNLNYLSEVLKKGHTSECGLLYTSKINHKVDMSTYNRFSKENCNKISINNKLYL